MGEFSARGTRQLLGFLFPHLNEGVSLLDRGCGPGNITIALAQEPRFVVELDKGSLDVGRELANLQGVSNVSFQTGSVYDLAFSDASFDNVVSNQ